MCESCECVSPTWRSLFTEPQRTNNTIKIISPVTTCRVQSTRYIFATHSIGLCLGLQISEQIWPKARTPTHYMPSPKQILTQNGHSRSFKVICFGVNEEPLRGCIVQYNDCGLACEGLEDIANPRKYPHKPYLDRRNRDPWATFLPLIQCSMGLSSFKFFW